MKFSAFCTFINRDGEEWSGEVGRERVEEGNSRLRDSRPVIKKPQHANVLPPVVPLNIDLMSCATYARFL